MKQLFAIIFIFTMLFWVSQANYTQIDLSSSQEQLIGIKNGASYKKTLDSIFVKYSENKEVLEKLKKRVISLQNQDVLLSEKNKQALWIILKYIEIRVDISLSALIKIEEEKQENSQVVDLPLQEEVQEVEYPGFWDNYNDEKKTLLAGWDTHYIYAGWIGAFYEDAQVEKLEVYIEGTDVSQIKNTLASIDLYLEWLLVANAGYSDIDILSPTKAKISFGSIKNFIALKDKNRDFRIAIKTQNIGYEQIWKPLIDAIVSEVTFSKVVGVTTGNNITNINVETFESEYFSVVPAQLSLVVEKSFDDSFQWEINISWNFWKNTQDTSKSEAVAELKTLKLSVWWNQSAIANYTLYNTDDSSNSIIGSYASWIVTFDVSAFSQNNKTISKGKWETFRIGVSGISTDSTLSFEIPKDTLIYDVPSITWANNMNINLPSSISLGSRKF